jgi:hypothetical protein
MGAMDKGLETDAWTLGLKLKGDYFLQTGNILDLKCLRQAIDTGIVTSINREIVKLSVLLSKVKLWK